MKRIDLMNVQRQHEEHKDEYESAMIDVLRSGRYIGGSQVELFEKEFADYNGVKYGISCGNGTDAIVLALRALNIGYGDEVITTAFTFYATAEGIANVGATPVFVDVSEETYCINPELIEKSITEKTKAIIVVHIYGHCADMDKIREIANRNNLYIITDCAQSTGTKYKGSFANALGDIACYSFFPTKILGCDGDGGMVLTNNEKIAKACKSFKTHGSGEEGLTTLIERYKSDGKSIPENMPLGKSKYYNYLIGYNSRLDAVQAALLRIKLKYLDEFIRKRRNNAQLYNDALKETDYITPFEKNDCEHSYYIYALRSEKAEDIMKKLNEAGIATGTYYPVPLHLQGAFAHLGYKRGDLPVSENLSKTTFAIPVFPELYDEERGYIISVLKRII